MDLILTQRDQNAVHQLLLAKPEPGSLLPRAAVDALVRLIPCDTIGAGEADDHGFLLHRFDLPAGVYDDLGPQCCDGPLPTGLIHLGAFTDDVLRLGFSTPAGTVVQLYLSRGRTTFSSRDVAALALLTPVLGRLMQLRSRLSTDDALSRSEMRVLELVAAGGSNRDVADHLSVTVATVRKHLEHSYRKLGVSNRTAAVAALTPTLAES